MKKISNVEIYIYKKKRTLQNFYANVLNLFLLFNIFKKNSKLSILARREILVLVILVIVEECSAVSS